jgi:4-hydroxy-tetrahydrodipicolinate synthase
MHGSGSTVSDPAVRERKRLRLEGFFPATVTPFAEDLSVDVAATRKHLASVAAADGVRGLVVNAGLGELLQLSLQEQIEIIEIAGEVRRPGQLVIAGVEGRSAGAVAKTSVALKDAGADALLVFPPFDIRAYRRFLTDPPSMYAFFAELDRDVDLPMIVFQFPPHSGSSYSLPVLLELAKIPNVVAVKAASGTAATYRETWDALHDKLSVLAAVDSPPLLDMLSHGSHGALIGIGAIAPAKWAELLRLTSARDLHAAGALFDTVCRPLMAAVFENQMPKRLTSEAAATKEALAQMGEIPSSRVRPPAVPVNEEVRAEIRSALIAAELIPGREAA